MSFLKINFDALGVTVSIACAIHCAVLPMAMATLPILGINIIHNPTFECTMIGMALLIGIRALLHGYRRHHHRLTPGVLFIAGMILLIAKQIWHGQEVVLLLLALPLILGAHAWNFRLNRAFSRIRNRQ